MNRKKVVIISISLLVLISLASISYASFKMSREFVYKQEKQIEERIKEVKAQEDEQKVEIQKAKVSERLSDAWSDIKKSHQIEDNDFIKLNLEQTISFLNGKLEGYSQEYLDGVQSTINDIILNAPTGSTEPIVLIQKDSTQILIAYKESGGDNTIVKLNQVENNWITTKETKKGIQIKEIND